MKAFLEAMLLYKHQLLYDTNIYMGGMGDLGEFDKMIKVTGKMNKSDTKS